VRDELEHLLDDNEDMTRLYLTRKWLQNQPSEALLGGVGSVSFTSDAHHLRRHSSVKSGSMLTSANLNDDDVEDLEMLLEAYFIQLDGTRNKILSVREYIDDTEDYVNIQLDNQRNELIQLQLTLTIASFAITFETLVAGLFSMNIPCHLYGIDGIFEPFVAGITAISVVLFLLVLGYARRKKLLVSDLISNNLSFVHSASALWQFRTNIVPNTRRITFKPGVICGNFQKEGHYQSKCYQLVAYPSGHPLHGKIKPQGNRANSGSNRINNFRPRTVNMMTEESPGQDGASTSEPSSSGGQDGDAVFPKMDSLQNQLNQVTMML
ncbi:magnesium transporter MRS2-4, partial [Tanacetum coccineum]